MSNIINFPSVYKGDVKVFAVNFRDGRKQPINLTSRTFYLTIKRNKNDPDSESILQKTWFLNSNPKVGQVIVEITALESLELEEGNFPIDLRASIQGDPKQIFATIEGVITVNQPVTLDILK